MLPWDGLHFQDRQTVLNPSSLSDLPTSVEVSETPPFHRSERPHASGREDHASILSVQFTPVQRLPSFPPLRQGVIQQLIILLPMMLLLQVAPCMQQHRVNAVHRCLGQPGIERDQTGAAAVPQRVLIDRGPGKAVGCPAAQCEEAYCETFTEHLPGKRATPPVASPQ